MASIRLWGRTGPTSARVKYLLNRYIFIPFFNINIFIFLLLSLLHVFIFVFIYREVLEYSSISNEAFPRPCDTHSQTFKQWQVSNPSMLPPLPQPSNPSPPSRNSTQRHSILLWAIGGIKKTEESSFASLPKRTNSTLLYRKIGSLSLPHAY